MELIRSPAPSVKERFIDQHELIKVILQHVDLWGFDRELSRTLFQKQPSCLVLFFDCQLRFADEVINEFELQDFSWC